MERKHTPARILAPFRWSSLLLVALLALSVAGCNKLKARDLLNKGVTAYKAGKFDQAIEEFKQAKQLDPDLLNARLYLATAYAGQYIPGAPSEENVRNGQQAIQEYKEVIEKDPGNLNAIDGIGSILYQMAGTPFDPEKMKESKRYHLEHIRLKPEDPDPYYWVGVIDWTLSWRANRELRADYNNKNPRKAVKEDEPLPPTVREQFDAEYGDVVRDGIDHLQKAIQLRQDYDDAMAYLNLLYRQRADQVATAQEREDYQRRADSLVDQVKEIKQRRMAQQPGPTT